MLDDETLDEARGAGLATIIAGCKDIESTVKNAEDADMFIHDLARLYSVLVRLERLTNNSDIVQRWDGGACGDNILD